MNEGEAEFIKNNFEFIITKHKLQTSVTNPFNMQSEFTALQSTIRNLTNLKQEFEQLRIFK